jgi:two-component system OmpR family sensor kinase
MRIISRPLILENGLEGVIQASTPLSDFLASLAELRQTLLFFVLPLGVALASLVSLLVVGQLLAPIRRIVAEVEGIQVADENRRVAVVGKDEFAELATTLNNMLSRLSQGIAAEKQANQKLREAMERQKRFTADASHEMKTPLAIIKAHSGLIAEESAYKQESISAIDEAATRMIQLTAGLLDLAKIDAQRDATMVPIFASALLKDLALSFAHEGSRITFQNDPADPAFLGQFDEATRALQNLIQNALTHGGPGQVLVKVVIREARIQFAVSDQGKGIPAEHLPHLFERFYRVDSSRNSQSGGSGLGLAIVQAIAERHLGTVSVQSDSTGTTFTLDLPLWQSKDV